MVGVGVPVGVGVFVGSSVGAERDSVGAGAEVPLEADEHPEIKTNVRISNRIFKCFMIKLPFCLRTGFKYRHNYFNSLLLNIQAKNRGGYD